MTQCLKALAVPVVALASIWLAACSTDESDPSPPPGESPVAVSEGGGPPQYSQPVIVAPGEYVSPAGYPEAREGGQQAERAEAGQPVFQGEINGMALRKMAPENFPDYCGDVDFAKFDPVEILKFGYLPPGTGVIAPQNAATCPDGTQAVVGEEFVGYNFLFEVYFRAGGSVILHDAPAERVSALTVNGLAGVAIKPLTIDGYGRSQIAWTTPNGILEVTATDLPFEELNKIAEGVQCESC